MAYYIDYDNDGNEIRTLKGRGRTRQGYEQRDDGNWYRVDGNFSSKPKGQYYWVSFDADGNYASHQIVKQGRRPLGCYKFEKTESGLRYCDTKEFPSNTDLSSIPGNQFGIVIHEKEESSHEATLPFPKTYGPKTEVIYNEEPEDIEVLLKCIKAMQRKSGNLISLYLCDIINEPPIDYFKTYPVHSRINILLNEQEVHVWRYEYREGEPDVIIQNAFMTSDNSVSS